MTFRLEDEDIALPVGAFAQSHRRILRHEGRIVLALTQGKLRPYIYPLFTPRGFPVTSESPADHPHHNSLWVAADHVHIRMPAVGGFEDYAYNFYVNDTFQGRAPGRQLETACEVIAAHANAIRIVQTIEWRGPIEWAAPLGRLILIETRVLDVAATADCHVVDVTSTLMAQEWDVAIGPTRHSYFNARASEAIAFSAAITDDRGDAAGRLPDLDCACWVDISGSVGGEHKAGLAILPHPADHVGLAWFVTKWGVMTAATHRRTGREISRGAAITMRCRFIAHDGDARAADIVGAFATYAATGGQ